MPRYLPSEARDWAREHFRGVVNVIIPSFANDMRSLNETAIRHDVRRDIDLGFSGALLVSEVNITPDEYIRFVEIAADEAGGRLVLVHHAMFNTFEDNVDVARRAAAAGADLALLCYPPTFYPASEQDIYEYSKAFCDSVGLGVMLFPVSFWGFDRLHGASLSMELLEQLVDDAHNVIAIKAEGGHPSIAGFAHVWTRLSDRVVVSMPILQQAIPLASLVPLQVIATSNTEYYGSAAPELFDLARVGKHDEALQRLWQIAPAWRANESVTPIPGGHMVHRMAWKYQAWLAGFNGGPLRLPTPRIIAREMRAYRQALSEAQLPVTQDPDEDFFVGRNPS